MGESAGIVIEVLQNAKTSYISGIATSGTGMFTLACFEVLPKLIGMAGVIFGMVVTYLVYKRQKKTDSIKQEKLLIELEIDKEILKNKRMRRKSDNPQD